MGSIISTVDLPTTEIIEPIKLKKELDNPVPFELFNATIRDK